MDEMDENEINDPLAEKRARDSNGRFRKGTSGNPRGRRTQFKRDPSLPASRRRIINTVADELVEVKVNGKVRQMTLYEANVRSLAMDGVRSRIAAQRFVDLAMSTSEKDLERRLLSHQVMERLNAVEEENERLRQTLEPRHGVVRLGMEAFEEWQAHRRLDDDAGVAAAFGKSPPDDD